MAIFDETSIEVESCNRSQRAGGVRNRNDEAVLLETERSSMQG